MPSTLRGTTPVSRKIASSRARTARRGTRGTARRSPAGKKKGSRRRQAYSVAKKMKAQVTLPAITVTPKSWRSASIQEKWCIASGSAMPQMRPAIVQPKSETAAIM